MARYWDDKDAHGNKLTDGRVCLVIEPDDTNLPAIRTYGRDKDEVLDKVAKTAETGQAEIHRLRSVKTSTAPSTPGAPSATPAGTPGAPTADELAIATADLSNPAKAPQALKTLLRGAGFNLDKIAFDEGMKRMTAVAQEWEKQHPDFPSDQRNDRQLMNTAVLHFGFQRNPTAEALDKAYAYLLENEMLFDVAPPTPVPPGGTPASRTAGTRTATSYRANALRTPVPVARTEKPKFTREEIAAMDSRTFEQKIWNVPENRDWYNREFSPTQARA